MVRKTYDLDPDVYEALVQYAKSKYGSKKALSKAVNDVVRQWLAVASRGVADDEVVDYLVTLGNSVMSAIQAVAEHIGDRELERMVRAYASVVAAAGANLTSKRSRHLRR